MYSERFQKFIEMWQKDFAIERTIDEKVCVDRDGNPLPWYTYPAIEYLSQFDYGEKTIFEFGCGYSSLFWAERQPKSSALKIIRNGLPNGSGNFNIRSWISAGGTKERFTKRRFLRTAADMT